MFFDKWLKSRDRNQLSPDLVQAIEDAVLLGDVAEIDDVLQQIHDDEDFPTEIRYALEALRHFRAYYGPGKDLEPREPLKKQKAAIMEIAWGAELLDTLRNENKIVALRTASTH